MSFESPPPAAPEVRPIFGRIPFQAPQFKVTNRREQVAINCRGAECAKLHFSPMRHFPARKCLSQPVAGGNFLECPTLPAYLLRFGVWSVCFWGPVIPPTPRCWKPRGVILSTLIFQFLYLFGNRVSSYIPDILACLKAWFQIFIGIS